LATVASGGTSRGLLCSPVGAFSATDLDQQPCDQKIDTLITAGITTTGVALSTLGDAADRDCRVCVPEDGGSDHHRHVHDLVTQRVSPRPAYVILIADLSTPLGTAR
jgi:nicotinamidase-related amidase